MPETSGRDHFFTLIGDSPGQKVELIQDAYWLAKNVHRPQARDSGERYFEHPRRVAVILLELGYARSDILINALLHDVLEDTFTPPRIIRKLFGGQAYRDLVLLSKKLPAIDETTGQIQGWAKVPTERYFEQLRQADRRIRLVKCADRLDNLRTCRIWPEQRISGYLAETGKYIIPLAAQTDPELLRQLTDQVNDLSAIAERVRG